MQADIEESEVKEILIRDPFSSQEKVVRQLPDRMRLYKVYLPNGDVGNECYYKRNK